jgi:hypothetical protein
MAAWLDLVKRLEDGLYRDNRLHVESVYRGAPLPEWIDAPLQVARENAGALRPVLVLNVKGAAVPDSLCVLRLRDLERLTAARLQVAEGAPIVTETVDTP